MIPIVSIIIDLAAVEGDISHGTVLIMIVNEKRVLSKTTQDIFLVMR